MSKLPAFLLAALVHGAVSAAPVAPATRAMQPVLDRISADSLRGHVSFLASDALEGRATPSRGLDIAAEYVAAQFRRAGLMPAGDDGYFQTANWQYAERDTAAFRLTVNAGAAIDVPAAQVGYDFRAGRHASGLQVVRLAAAEVTKQPHAADGKALVIAGTVRDSMAAAHELAKAGGTPALVLVPDATRKDGNGGNKGWLVDPEAATPTGARAPIIVVHADSAIAALNGAAPATVSFDIPDGKSRPVKLRNVIAVLPGSDPKLKDTYVIVSAHYDHVGIENGEVFNGANDDASGTASVMEIASAMATMKQRPRRSIVFMTVWGEELGMVGSRYYGKHPVFPITKTVANLNLEHMGRTDDMEGTRINTASLTGMDYSGVGDVVQQAGASLGIKVFRHPQFSDAFFGRSDNQALADQGVPSHTLCVAFGFPDYHGKDDTWDKIDYDNMARVDRMVALAVHMLADSATAPQWNAANAKVAPYVKAARAMSAAAK